ncbi:MAG: type II toxin-antitoxin system RelE/ParE family toxin [Thermoleophilia bacterium]
MKIYRTPRFDRAYRKLPPDVRVQFKKKIRLLAASDLRHPSLRVKKIRGTAGIYEASINIAYRFTFEMRDDGILLRVIGSHDVLERP